MRRIAIWVGAVGAVTLLSACPPAYPKCSSDEGCKEHNEVCVQGQCQECATDANCKEGFVCDANKCVPKPECKDDKGCGAGQKCKAGKCVVHECEKDADCPAGAKCTQNRCVAPTRGCTTNEDCGSGEECKAGACVAKAEVSCAYEPIYFDFNEHKLSGSAQSKLAALADCIKKQKVKLTIEGNADERGTEEYNMQLSNKRASSVKRYLADLGVPAGSLDTVGYGENRPAVSGHDEDAWAKNRRVEFTKR